MPLLAELFAFYVSVAIKISLLRSCESHRLNQAQSRITFFNPTVPGSRQTATGNLLTIPQIDAYDQLADAIPPGVVTDSRSRSPATERELREATRELQLSGLSQLV